MKRLLAFCLTLTLATVALAHPHFRKSLELKIGQTDVSLAYYTVPINMSRVDKTPVGEFVTPGRPKLVTSSDFKAGSVSIPAGTYTVGAIKNSAEDWTMALSPGELGPRDKPDMSKLIKLDSQLVKGPNMGHLMVDVIPGHAKSEGKAVVVIGFGTLWLDGVLSDAVAAQ